MKDFRQLHVWQKAHRLALEIYGVSAGFPRSEMYGLTSQVRRAAASISANIAEGCGRNGDAEFGRFLYISFGSASELESHMILALDLKLMSQTDYDRVCGQVSEVKRMLAGLIQKLRAEREERSAVSDRLPESEAEG